MEKSPFKLKGPVSVLGESPQPGPCAQWDSPILAIDESFSGGTSGLPPVDEPQREPTTPLAHKPTARPPCQGGEPRAATNTKREICGLPVFSAAVGVLTNGLFRGSHAFEPNFRFSSTKEISQFGVDNQWLRGYEVPILLPVCFRRVKPEPLTSFAKATAVEERAFS